MSTTHLQWQALSSLATDEGLPTLAELVTQPRPYLQCRATGITIDLQKQRIDERVFGALLALAEHCNWTEARTALFAGERINQTEERAVQHMAPRTPLNTLQQRLANGSAQALSVGEVSEQIGNSRRDMAAFVNQVRACHWLGIGGKPINQIINIGIGGSHLGPELATCALAGPEDLPVGFLSNVDGNNLQRTLRHADPTRTLFVIASKSFGTQETAINARQARSWFLERTGSLQGIERHFVAVSNNLQGASEFGIPASNVFGMGDWVGGRYSVWSSVGLAVALAIGWKQFEALLAGAADMDEHFLSAPAESNVPLLLALAGIWNNNFLGCESYAVLPYDDRLRLLPDYLQQLEMESNGKRTRLDGQPVDYHTSPILWGGRGTNGQHAFHQLLHQGTRRYSADFVLCREAGHPYRTNHQVLLANALAQSQAMAVGRAHENPHRAVPGNHPSTTIILDQLTPTHLGALLAAYEHKVFCQGVIWHINSFDQWGVELGKDLANPILAELADQTSHHQDAATAALIQLLQDR